MLLSVLNFRVNRRYVEANPRFIGIELDISDSSREGCAVSTLTITSEPKDWRGAVQASVPRESLRCLTTDMAGTDKSMFDVCKGDDCLLIGVVLFQIAVTTSGALLSVQSSD